MVICEYEQVANMDSVVIEIQQNLDQLSGAWDDTVSAPIIMQIDPDMLPVMTAAVDVEGMDSIAVSEYVENELIPALESIEGVASASATGSIEEKVMVTLNTEKINALNEKIQNEINKQFEEPESEIQNGLDQLEDGKEALLDGSEQLGTGIGEGMQEVLEQQNKLYKTKEELVKQLSELKEQKTVLETIQKILDEFLVSDTYAKMIELGKEIDALRELINSNNFIPEEQLEAFREQLAEAQAKWEEANKGIGLDFSALEELGFKVEDFSDLSSVSASLGTMLTQMNVGIETIESALKQIEDGEVALDQALGMINANEVGIKKCHRHGRLPHDGRGRIDPDHSHDG